VVLPYFSSVNQLTGWGRHPRRVYSNLRGGFLLASSPVSPETPIYKG